MIITYILGAPDPEMTAIDSVRGWSPRERPLAATPEGMRHD